MEKLLTEELLKQIKLINYNRGKTLIENNKIILSEQSAWSKTEEGKRTIKFLTDLGHDRLILQDAKSANNAYNLAAYSAIRKLTEKLVTINYSQTDPFFRVTVLNNKPSGGVQKFSAFDSNMIDRLKSNIDNREKKYSVNYDTFKSTEIGTDRTVGGTFILEDFYFNSGKIFNTLKDLDSASNYLFPDGIYNFFTQYFGGDNVRTIMSGIESQNVTNRPQLVKKDGWKQITIGNRVTNETDWKPIIETAHWVLPLVSFVLNVFGGPPGMVVGAGLETIDAALYQFYDEDPYMAGLSLIFALVPLGELAQIPGFKQVTKEGVQEGLEKILWKQIRKEPLEESEELFLLNMAKNKKVQKEFNQAVLNVSLRKLLTESPKGYTDVLTEIMIRGFLSYRSYSTIINLIFSTAAFDYWAYHNLGKCSATFKFSDLLKLLPETDGVSVSNLIRQIEVQPFTDTKDACKRIVEIQLAKNREKLLQEYKKYFTKLASTVLLQIIESNGVLNTSASSRFEYEVAIIQNILYQCGFTKKDILIQVKNGKFVFNDSKRVKKVIISTSSGRKIQTIENEGQTKFYSKNVSDGTYIVLIYVDGEEKPVTRKFIVINNMSDLYSMTTESEKFNWGYYDEKTKKSIEDFQKYFKLDVDGEAGKDTLSKMYSITTKQTCGVLKNHSGIELSPQEDYLINKEVIKSLYDKAFSNYKEPTFDDMTEEQLKLIDKELQKNLLIDSDSEVVDTLQQIDNSLNK